MRIMSLTLAQAARQVGLHRSNLLRAIKSGRISGVRDDSGAWHVDESELVRVYGDLRSATLQPAHPDALTALELKHAEQRICDLTRQLERALCDVADWKEQAMRLTLPKPVPQVSEPQPKPEANVEVKSPEARSRMRRLARWLNG
jgi:hypothetical protein